jgi:hypothetical protein
VQCTVFFVSTASRVTALHLAARADVDPRTAAKALRLGVDAVRGRPAERLAEAAKALGINLPSPSPPPKGRAA